jgi:CRISPR-associated endonuclease/helicase Cas3
MPVSRTEKEVFMGVSTDRPKSGVFYTSIKLQPLDEHLFAIGYFVKQRYKQLFPASQHGSIVNITQWEWC